MVAYPYYESADALVESADLVVVGTALSSREDTLLPSFEGDDPEENPRAGMNEEPTEEELRAGGVAVTVTTVRIDDLVVGTEDVGDEIEVSQVTSEAGNTIIGGQVLLFLVGTDGLFHVLGGAQGQWIEEDGTFRAVAEERTDLQLSASDLAGLGER